MFQPSFHSRHSSRSAFTMIELLIVVGIIGILMGLLSTGIRRSVQNAKDRRRASEVSSLKTAVVNYWHDYNRWPLGSDSGSAKVRNALNGSGKLVYADDNHTVFDCLAPRNTQYNPSKKSYIDTTAFYTWTNGRKGSSIRTLAVSYGGAELFKEGCSLVDYEGKAYTVTIDLKNNTVTVE